MSEADANVASATRTDTPVPDDVESGDSRCLETQPSTDNDNRPSQPALMSSFLANLRTSPATKNPKATLQAVYGAGEYKAGLSLDILMVQSFMVRRT